MEDWQSNSEYSSGYDEDMPIIKVTCARTYKQLRYDVCLFVCLFLVVLGDCEELQKERPCHSASVCDWKVGKEPLLVSTTSVFLTLQNYHQTISWFLLQAFF